MPFKSDAQRKFMYARHPKIAKRWRKEYGPQTDLPERKNKHALDGLKKARGK